MQIHINSFIIIEKVFNRPITKFYNSDDVKAIVEELQLTRKRGQLLYIRSIIFYKKQC